MSQAIVQKDQLETIAEAVLSELSFENVAINTVVLLFYPLEAIHFYNIQNDCSKISICSCGSSTCRMNFRHVSMARETPPSQAQLASPAPPLADDNLTLYAPHPTPRFTHTHSSAPPWSPLRFHFLGKFILDLSRGQIPLPYALMGACVKLFISGTSYAVLYLLAYLFLQQHKNEECAVSGQELCLVQNCREACRHKSIKR